MSRLPVYLKGSAELWYRDFRKKSGETSDIIDVFNGLREGFRHKNFRSISQNLLTNRIQNMTEPAHQYYYDVLRLCNKVNPDMGEDEKITHLIRGLKSSILEKVLVLEPKDCKDLLSKIKSVEEAEILANSRPNYNYVLFNQKISALSQDANVSSPDEFIKSKKTKSEIEPKSDEIKQISDMMRTLLGEIRSRDTRKVDNNKGRDPSPPKTKQTTRTVDGKIVCRYCTKVGHFEKNCFRKKIDELEARNKPTNEENGRPDQGNG